MKKLLFIVLILFSQNFCATLPRILIKIPTRERPTQFFSILDIYYKKLSGKIPYMFLISCDEDDKTMNNQEIKEKFNTYPNLVVRFGANKNKIEAYNANIDEFIDQFHILVVTSDDMEPMIEKFDLVIVKAMLTYFPDLTGVLSFADGFTKDQINTYPILGVNYYKEFGYVYYPEYQGVFCDNELRDVARLLKKEVRFENTVLFKHLLIRDNLYAKNDKYWNGDKKLYFTRRSNNFFIYPQEFSFY